MKIVLTGATGQVGQEIVEQARTISCELIPFAKADLDITDIQQLDRMVKAQRPELMINAAAYTAVDKAEQETARAFAVNRDGIHNMAQVCKHYAVPLLHISTDYVFDGNKPDAYQEQDARAPLNVYGASKAQGEQVLQEEWEQHVIVRTSWVFGKHGPNFVKTIIRLALKQPELRIVSDQRGCPTAACDLAAALLHLAQQIKQGQPRWGVFHYCGDQPTTWFEFAQRIIRYGKDYFPFKVEKLHAIATSEFPTPAKRPHNSVLNQEKIAKEYGLQPSVWQSALQQLIQYIYQKGEWREHI